MDVCIIAGFVSEFISAALTDPVWVSLCSPTQASRDTNQGWDGKVSLRMLQPAGPRGTTQVCVMMLGGLPFAHGLAHIWHYQMFVFAHLVRVQVSHAIDTV